MQRKRDRRSSRRRAAADLAKLGPMPAARIRSTLGNAGEYHQLAPGVRMRVTVNRPDLADPFGPADRDPDERLRCLHCGQEFRVRDVRWEPKQTLWVCPHWPACDGGGIGFDLVAVDPADRSDSDSTTG